MAEKSTFVHNVVSRAWEAVSANTEGWIGESARERRREQYGRTLTLTLEQERNEILATLSEPGRVRRRAFGIGEDESGHPTLTERGGYDTRSVGEVVEDLSNWQPQ